MQEDSSARGDSLVGKNNALKAKTETTKKAVAAAFRPDSSETTLNLKSAKFIDPKTLNENKTEAVVKTDPARGIGPVTDPARGIDPVKFASNGGFDPTIWGTMDTSQWQLDASGNITGYTGDMSHIIIPNSADFAKAGKNYRQISINSDEMKKLGSISNSKADTLAISLTDNKKVKASDTLWSSTFNSTLLKQADLEGLDTSNVTNMSAMFSNDSSLRVLFVDNWDTSNVTNMGSMFKNASSLTNLDLSNWNTSNVTNMSYMFYGASSLRLLAADWDTSHVTDMGHMFDGASTLDRLNLARWDTSNVTNMSAMFSNDSSLRVLFVDNWDTSHVTDMSDMFSGDIHLELLSDVSNWNTSNVTNMGSMFKNASSLTNLDLSKWDTSNVTDMSSMFDGADKLVLIVNNKLALIVNNKMGWQHATDNGAFNVAPVVITNNPNILHVRNISYYTIDDNSIPRSAIFDLAHLPHLPHLGAYVGRIPRYYTKMPSDMKMEYATDIVKLYNQQMMQNYEDGHPDRKIEYRHDPKQYGYDPIALARAEFVTTQRVSVTPNDQDIDPDTGKTIDEMTHVDLTYGINIYVPNTNYDGHNLDYHEERDFKLTRTATKDAVTGKITYSKWTGTVTGKTNRESEWPTANHPNMWNAAVGTVNRVLTWDSFVNNNSGLALGMPLGPLTAGKGYTLQVPDDVAVNEFTDNRYTIDLNKDIHTVSDPLTWAASKNIDIYVNADKQTSSWKFVDDTGIDGVTDQALIDAHNDVLKTHEFNGYTDENVSLYIAVPAGYKLADNASIPTNYTFHAENNQPIEIHLVHEVETAIDKNHIPDGAKKSDGSNVTSEDFSETVTRHITINMPNHDGQGGTNAIDETQTKTLTRTGDYDVVTKIMTFGPWSKDTFEAVPVPTVAGYTPSQDKIDTADATDGFVDPKIEVTYTANDSTQTIHYVDENGHELSTTDNKDQNGDVIKDSTVTVKTDEVGNVQVPKGWKLVDDHDQTTKVSYGDDGTIPVKNVAITHATIEVTPDTPHAKGDPIDPKVPTGSKYGAGLTSDDLNDVAYREIHFKLPASTNAEDYVQRLKANGLSSAHVEEGTNNVIVRQEVAYKRTAIVDAITGEVKGYNPAGVKNQGWVPSADKLVDAVMKNDNAVFNKVLIPQIAGYKAHLDDTKVTVAKLANGSHAALSQLFVSFMALPKPIAPAKSA